MTSPLIRRMRQWTVKSWYRVAGVHVPASASASTEARIAASAASRSAGSPGSSSGARLVRRRAVVGQLDEHVLRRRARLRPGGGRAPGLIRHHSHHRSRRRTEDQRPAVDRGLGRRHQGERGGAGTGQRRADRDRCRALGQGRPQRHEMPARQVAEHLRLAALQPEQVGGARHVDVEEGAAHQEVRRLRRHVLGELGQPLGGDDAGEPPLAAATHQVGHRAERQPARLVRHLAGDGGGEQLRLVHHHQHRIPLRPVGVEQPAEEGGGGPHLVLGVEALQRQHHGDAVLTHPGGDALQLDIVAVRLDHHVAVALGEGDEIPLRDRSPPAARARRSAPAAGAAGATCRSRNCPGRGAGWRAVRRGRAPPSHPPARGQSRDSCGTIHGRDPYHAGARRRARAGARPQAGRVIPEAGRALPEAWGPQIVSVPAFAAA